jgi:hypothetical protein
MWAMPGPTWLNLVRTAAWRMRLKVVPLGHQAESSFPATPARFPLRRPPLDRLQARPRPKSTGSGQGMLRKLTHSGRPRRNHAEHLLLVVAIIGVVGLLFSLRQAYRARLRQFEEKYVERYWSILDSLSLAALSISDQLPDHDDEMTIRKYIFLCEDELQMRKNGYISDETYYEWADGMLDQLQQPMFKEVWDRIQDEAKQHKRGVFPYENLRNLDATTEKGMWDIAALKRGDPLKQPATVRTIRGLKGITGI